MARTKKEEKAVESTDNKKGTDLVEKTTSTALAAPTIDFGADAGAGFEGAEADAFAIPYLVVLQKNSPQVDDASGKFIKGAKAGHFFNTVTNEVFESVDFIPATYQRRFVNWKPRDEGGGFLGSYDASDSIVSKGVRNDSGKLELPDGSYLADTRYHFGLMVKADGTFEPVIVAFASTQIKKSRIFMSLMNGIKLKRGDGSIFTPPMFSHVYRLTSVNESNDKGSWKGVKIELARMLGAVKGDAELYTSAKLFKEQVESGAAKASAPEAEVVGSHAADDEGDDF